MICPKCRTKYPEDVTVCPDCGVELIGYMGAADAVDEPEEEKSRRIFSSRKDEEPISEAPAEHEIMHEVIVNEDDEFSPVVYKSSNTDEVEDEAGTGSIGVVFLVISLLFLAASGFMFYLGRSVDAQTAANSVAACISSAAFSGTFGF